MSDTIGVFSGTGEPTCPPELPYRSEIRFRRHLPHLRRHPSSPRLPSLGGSLAAPAPATRCNESNRNSLNDNTSKSALSLSHCQVDLGGEVRVRTDRREMSRPTLQQSLGSPRSLQKSLFQAAPFGQKALLPPPFNAFHL